MQAYGRAFARVYNKRWTGFAHRVAPLIAEFYASTTPGKANRSILDLCCGTGQLTLHLLEQGYTVTGLDLSEHMLQYARENASAYVESGQAGFVRADAAGFSLEQQFGLVVSTFDALNHLDSQEALQTCFQSVFAVLIEGGYFVFDLNTRAGLLRWNNIGVDDSEEAMIVTRGIFDGQGNRAYTRVSGFIKAASGQYDRFEETVYNTVFDMAWVQDTLLQIGWRDVHFARYEALATPIAEPEKEGRVFFVALR
jgi:SAM-dependent methyltransferase